MTIQMNPYDVLEWPSVKCLVKHLDDVRMVVATGERNTNVSWKRVFRDNLEVFEKAISSMPGEENFRHNVYRVLISCLLREFNKWNQMLDPLAGHPEISLCRDSIDLIIRYVAVCFKHTVFDDPCNCLYKIGKEVNEINSTFCRDWFLCQIAGHLGITEDIARRQKCDQCNRCMKRNCDGRYWDGLCGKPELLTVNCDDLILIKRYNILGINGLTKDSVSGQKEPSIHNEKVILTNETTKNLGINMIENNVSLTKVDISSRIKTGKKEIKVSGDNSIEQRRLLNEAKRRLKREKICDKEGRFINESLEKLLIAHDRDKVIKGTLPTGQLKGMIADAVRDFSGIGRRWKEVDALFKEKNLRSRYGNAKGNKKEVRKVMVDIIRDVFPNYKKRESVNNS